MATRNLTAQQIQYQKHLETLRRQIQVKQRLIELNKRRARAAKAVARRTVSARYIISNLTPAQRKQRLGKLRAAMNKWRAQNQIARSRASRPKVSARGMGLFKK